MATTIDSKKRVLVVGLICLDIVNVCDQYPQEDQDKPALDQRWQRGGNAANQSEILAQLGMEVEFLGSLSDSHAVDFAVNSLKKHGVITKNCVVHKGFGFPTSCVTLSLVTGSRTIVHFRPVNFPEVCVEDFKKLNFGDYHWIHFEVRRNFKETLEMVEIVDSFNNSRRPSERIKISIEMEKKHEKSKDLFAAAELIIISKDLAEFLGYNSSSSAVKGLYDRLQPGGTLVCPWGSLGADGIGSDGVLVHSGSYPPDTLKDTLGAGDTFIAGLISSLIDGHSLQNSLKKGCKLAGFKCGRDGYDGLGEFWAIIK